MRHPGLLALALVFFATFWLMTPTARAQNTSRPATRPSSHSSTWAAQTLKKMTVREKLGQMLMPYYFGVFASTGSG